MDNWISGRSLPCTLQLILHDVLGYLRITSLQKYCKLLKLQLRLCFRNTQGKDRGSLETTGPGCEMFHQDLKTV